MAEIIEVESIDFPVDADNAIMDDNGKVIQAVNDKGVTYKVKGSVNPLEPEKPKDDPKQAPVDKKDKPTDVAAPKPTEKPIEKDKPLEKKDEVKYNNQADYVLKSLGYEKEEVDLGDEGGVVKISDLTPDQQINVIVHEFEETIAEYQQKLEELQTARTPELKFEDPTAQQIVDYLKEGGDIKKLAKEILSRDPAAQARMLSDEEIVKAGIKKEFPGFTDEDINDEFKDLSPEKVARRAKALRAKMESEKPDFSMLTKEQRDANAALELQAIKDFTTEADKVKEAAKKTEKIAGFPIDDTMRNFLLAKIIPKDKDSDSTFVTELSANPGKLLRLQFLDAYAEKMHEKIAKHYYDLGLAKGNEGKEKLSDEPLRSYGTRHTTKKQQAAKDLNDPDFNFAEFVDAAQF